MRKIFNKILVFLHLKAEEARINKSDYEPKKFGESKSVAYEMQGMTDTFCQVTEWPNGEGFDISIQTKQKYGWDQKSISLHTDELECMMSGLNELNYFEYD